MNYGLRYWPAADEVLHQLETDPAMGRVLQAVGRTLQRLAVDPFNPRLGTVPFMTEALGGINATPARLDDEGNWYVLWQRGEEPGTIEIVLVHQIRR